MKPTMAQNQSNWEADKMLDVYIYDYLMKRKLHATAKAFVAEGKVATDPVAIDAPGGFLYEWWSVFWDIFISRTNEKHSEAAAAYIETQQTKVREHQQLQIQQMQLMQQRNAQLQRRDPNHPALGSSINAMNSEGMLGQQPASVLAMKMYEDRMKHPQPMDSEASPTLIDANRMALLKSAASHQGQLVHGNSGNMSTALHQIPGRTPLTTDIKTEVNLGAPPKSLPMDTSVYRQAILQSKSGLGSAGLNQGVTGLPLKGWPLASGIDQLRPNLGVQVPKPNLTTQNQFVMSSQQQQVLTQNNLGNSSYGDMDPRRLSGLPRGSLSAKDGQSTRNDGSICSQMQSDSPKQMKMAQSQHSLSQQQEQLQQHQLQQNNRKRKQHSGAANSTGTGNTAVPSPNSPPSTHTPGDGLNTANNMQHVNNVQKSMMMYGTEATGGLASSSNLLEDMERFGDVDALDDNVESFLSNDGGDGGNLYGAVKQSPAEQQKESSKGFTFAEVSSIRSRNSKVTCCHFSSDGKWLASAGDDMKVVFWNMDTFKTENSPAEHKAVITDVRYRPNSLQVATASMDKCVRLWDTTNPNRCVQEYSGHSSPIVSLDFHPKKTELFCFCDGENEIRYWNINSPNSMRATKGGNTQVRFQPRLGHLLAAGSDKGVSIFDVESDTKIYSLQGHPDPVSYICWDGNGEALASVSLNMVKIWSLNSGECVQEISSTGSGFHSCVFHPSYSTLLVIGGFSCLELWNMSENKSMTIPAHENVISSMAQSSVTGMVASASFDNYVKVWK
ncbi:transcriptional corepressor LEUNIG_HOMOLOG-like isoform X1 [Vigna umbellata]|uniref:transcriptional corepressor LEUNIG_HOMOLOG-like isoform X1 n=1 Tax=Vigna umbellata TaxID=87088 RepID=UPI001F5EB04B|nr:transcriptional corepressor LEUNIG_HOMOLOG-like isoform X1 [Vigna umbellata]